MQNWKKLGRLFAPEEGLKSIKGRAYLPFAEFLNGDLFRIYFTPTDNENRGYVAFIDININEPKKIINYSKSPLIKANEIGYFDDSGSVMGCLINNNDNKYLYYTGWSLGVRIPFYYYIGLAVSQDGGKKFIKYSNVPILDRNETDLFMTASPSILIEGKTWRMWYVSGVNWKMEDNKPKHYYHIKYAESKDGIKWERKGIVAIDFKSKKEYAISRPCVLKENGLYRMWYSCRASERAETYRMGYAESYDGIKWKRNDREVGLDVSKEGWDSDMICYPYVFNHKGQKYMLYNGNGYGRTGFGLAVLEN